jgi:tRNA(Ile)-lysidine synthase
MKLEPGGMPLVKEVRQILVGAALRDTSVVVAVSGGTDSQALLGAMVRLRDNLGLALTVAHLDHGLRPNSSSDALTVVEIAHQFGIPCVVEKVDVREHQERFRLSLEEAARNLRYDFLTRTAESVGAGAVVLGHTADDQAETVLLHIVQGSGLAGLRGMAAVSRYSGNGRAAVILVRPFLAVGRETTEAACSIWGLQPLQDETNLELDRSRNYLRAEVIPRMRRLNPRVREALVRLATTAARDLEYMNEKVKDAWADVGAEDVSLQADAVRGLHPALQRYLLREAYRQVRGDVQGLRQIHLDSMIHLLLESGGTILDLPHGVRMERQRDRATLTQGTANPPLPLLKGRQSLPIPGEIIVGNTWRIFVDEVAPSYPLDLGPYAAVLDADTLGKSLEVRSRRPGDRFQPLGVLSNYDVDGSGKPGKKLQDFMVDAHIPRSWRDRVPLLVTPKGVVWVVGWRIAHWARVTTKTRRCVTVKFTMEATSGG